MNWCPRFRWLGASIAMALLLVGCRADAPRSAAREAETKAPASSPAPSHTSEPPNVRPTPKPTEQASAGPAAPLAGSIPLVRGLVLVSALAKPDGDRENVVTISNVAPEGVTYVWQYRERDAAGGGSEGRYERFVRANDLASAPRLNTVYATGRNTESPGYTAFSISRAVYARVQAGESVPFTVTGLDDPQLGGLLATRVTLKGTLARTSPTAERMPVLVNGQRVSVPALRLHGQFAFQERREDGDYWVLADSTHPLLLKVVIGPNVFQTVRIELPAQPDAPAAAVERALADECRAELPGIYFAFASAALDPASDRALGQAAELLRRHADWSLVIEGHTDNVGDPASNRTLSLRRAESVRAALAEQHGVMPSRLEATGLGDTKPREPNGTLEGRARNRRVELVRRCVGANGN